MVPPASEAGWVIGGPGSVSLLGAGASRVQELGGAGSPQGENREARASGWLLGSRAVAHVPGLVAAWDTGIPSFTVTQLRCKSSHPPESAFSGSFSWLIQEDGESSRNQVSMWMPFLVRDRTPDLGMEETAQFSAREVCLCVCVCEILTHLFRPERTS